LRRSVIAYAVAIVALVGAILLRWLLDPLLGNSLALVTLFGAVAAAVWVGGFVPAVVVAILGYIACAYLFIEPRGALGLEVAGNIVGLVAYLVTCSLLIGIGEAMRFAQRRASERSELLRVTLGSIGDAVITTDTKGRVTYLNAVAESLTGWLHYEALGQRLDRVFRINDEHNRRTLENPAISALREGSAVGLANHSVLIGRDGVERPIDNSAAPIKDERGHDLGCVLIFRDVSERRRWKKAEADRLLSARLLAAIVESSDDAIISKTLDSVIQSWNAGAERLFGYTSEQAVGRHISLIIPPECIAEEDHIIATLKAGQRVDHFETERLRSDGRRILVSLTISPIKDDATGNIVGASKIARDITERKQAEAEREKFVTLVENSTDFIGMCDLQGVPFFVNRAGLQMVGLEGIEQARRTHVRDFFFPEDQPRIMDELFPSVIESGHGEIEIRFRHFQTGASRWMAFKVLKLTGAYGDAIGFATVSQDVTERKQLEDDLRKLAADLSETDRRKTEFLATLSHELRNPLAPLASMLEILKRDSGDAETRRHALSTMVRQLAQLVRLVDDLLDLNRITHNRITLHKDQVELAAVIHEAVQASRSAIESAGHDLRVVGPAEPILIYADPIRLSQMFGNLLNNSCKYTEPGGKITVTMEQQGNEVVVSVADTGMGIPPDKLDSIFEMFTQVDSSLERSQGGLGIGLTLVQRLVQLHGGSVKVRSAGEGRGSEFVVRLPRIVEGSRAEAAELGAAPEPMHPRRILVVDDNLDAAASLAMLLQLSGNEIYTTHDGAGALEAAEQHRPEVILLDIGLPTMNGYEVCRRIRQQTWGKQIVLIALTGWGQEEDRRRSHEAGFDGHLVKPVDYAVLTTLLSSLAAPRHGG
jgi:PAS domain S-box-containing protein